MNKELKELAREEFGCELIPNNEKSSFAELFGGERLINAMAYRKELEEEVKFHKDCDNREIVQGLEIAIADLGDTPTVNAARVVHGYWHDIYQVNGWCSTGRCSVCEKQAVLPVRAVFGTDYCPNCGAKMDGDGNG